MSQGPDVTRLNALKAAAYDTMAQLEHLQVRLQELNRLIAEEARRLEAGAQAASNGRPEAPSAAEAAGEPR